MRRYPNVVSMSEAPEKADYGDVDPLIELPSSTPFPAQQVAIDLGAERCKENNPTYCFAIPLNDVTTESKVFAQVDVQRCLPGDLQWTLFLLGHGDLSSILGTFNYGYGFTMKNDGFFVRIKEQEARNWSASQVFLSKDLALVMQFMELDKHKFDQGFDSVQGLFEWTTKSRLLNRKLVEKRKDSSEMRGRMEKRPMFRRFVLEYLPTFFGKEDEFNTRRAKVLLDNADDHAWDIIRTTVLMPLAQLEAKRLNEVVRALKRFVAFKDGRPYMCDEPEMNDENQARFAQAINEADEVKPSVREWILSNWEEVKARERQRAKASRRAAGQAG
ncbi:hypothetical protein D6C82_10029 [Aureobasidium pullulans]|nr:hypothetical protein D6C82_10029 [Aureobasidium pullulans]